MKEITQRQAEVLRYIKGYIKKKGYAPSHAEICKYFGFKSQQASLGHINALKRKGYIEEGRYDHKTKIKTKEKSWQESTKQQLLGIWETIQK